MNCRYAREIINSIIDRESHPLEAEAREHVLECGSCREWQASMDHALGIMAAAEAPPMPDIAAMVMSRLPAAHPASRQVAMSPRKALSWLGVAWLLGAIVVAGLLIAVLPTVNIGGLGHAISVIRTMLSPLAAVFAVGRAVAVVIGQGTMGIARAVGLGPALMVPLVLDLLLLGVVLLVWHRRHLAASACLV